MPRSPASWAGLGRRWRAGSTVGGRGRLRQLAPPEPVRRYQKQFAGELLHLDIKRLGRIDDIGHRIHDDRRIGKRGIGWELVHVAIDDASRLSYVEVLPDERGITAAGFLERAVTWLGGCGIEVGKVLTDTGSCHRSSTSTQLCLRLGIRPFIQTLLRECPCLHFPHLARRD